MRHEIAWLEGALATKDVNPVMTYYRFRDRVIQATDNRLIAGCPSDVEGDFLVPGAELMAILKRLPDDVGITCSNGLLRLRAGRFSGTLQVLPPEDWRFVGLDEDPPWRPFPRELVPIWRDLHPFISKNAVHIWSLGLAVDNGYCYATNNFVFAGAPAPSTVGLKALIPEWVIEFILDHTEALDQWAIAHNYIAFKWRGGAWMRANLFDAEFPERGGEMIRNTPQGTQFIDPDYREAVTRIGELSETTVSVYADHVEGRTLRTTVREELVSEVPEGSEFSLWTAEYLVPMMAVANWWSPSMWPAPVPWNGTRIHGYIASRVG